MTSGQWGWVELHNNFFNQSPQYELKKGLSLEAAQSYVEANKNVALGITEGPSSVCTVAKIGTPKFATDKDYTVHIYKKTLPPSDDPNLFEDDFANTEEATATVHDWVRPGRGDGLGDEFQNISLFSSISPDDLSQGGLGDCWLISAFAAIAEFPNALMALFDQKGISSDGKYTVNLYSWKERRMVKITVDDRLPCSMSALGSPSLAYVKMSHDGEIWPCILEKAFAAYSKSATNASNGEELVGGYTGLKGGQSIFAFAAMTGCTDVTYYKFMDEEDEWASIEPRWTDDNVHTSTGWASKSTSGAPEFLGMLADFDRKEFLMCANTGAGSDTTTSDHGIVQGHAYSLLRVELNVAGSGVDLLQLRNPWGKKEWSGDWSDSSPLWEEHPDVQQALHHTAVDDGMFWIDYHDFCDNYKSVVVCKKSVGKNRGKVNADGLEELMQQGVDIIDGFSAGGLKLNRATYGSFFKQLSQLFSLGC